MIDNQVCLRKIPVNWHPCELVVTGVGLTPGWFLTLQYVVGSHWGPRWVPGW